MSIAGVPPLELLTSEAINTRLVAQLLAERGQHLDAVPNDPLARAELLYRT